MKTLRPTHQRASRITRPFVKRVRKKLGNLSSAYVSDVELRRRFPSEKVLEKMARALKVSADELRSYDSRAPIDELKHLAASNPTHGFVLRNMVEGEITAEDLIKCGLSFASCIFGELKGDPGESVFFLALTACIV